jgi:pimeloyl-ACP methyl ester carboxylesterase
MRRFAAFRSLILPSAILCATLSPLAVALDGLARETSPPPTNIVIGFVGGFVNHDNPHHGPVKLARRIQQAFPQDTYVRVFENRHRKRAYNDIIRQLDSNHDGFLSPEEKARARIILFGQSWGGAAAVLLARDLRRQGVRVLLTVQVDSVAKSWQNDAVIPDNVAEAANFYQPHGIIHGRPRIIAANPSRTEILGNTLMDYRKDPVQCPEASWFDHVFTPGHMQTECDPRLWSQIETMVHQRLSFPNPSPETPAAVSAEIRPSAETH